MILEPYQLMMSMMMMMIMVMNCFCGMVDQRKAFSFISSHEHCQRSSPSQISDTLQAGFQPVHNPSLGFDEWSCAVVITTTLENNQQPQKLTWNSLSPETHLQSDLRFFCVVKKCFPFAGKQPDERTSVFKRQKIHWKYSTNQGSFEMLYPRNYFTVIRVASGNTQIAW